MILHICSVDAIYASTYTTDFRIELYSTGRIIWSFGGNFATTCQLDITYFPFDKQKCSIEIKNWSYTQMAVNLFSMTDTIDTDDMYPNGEWNVRRTGVDVTPYTKDSHPGKTFPRIRFSLYLDRKSAYYIMNVVTPCIFCIAISLLVFWLPPESGEKVTLGITVLLAFSVFQLTVASNTPVTSDFTPLLSTYISSKFKVLFTYKFQFKKP